MFAVNNLTAMSSLEGFPYPENRCQQTLKVEPLEVSIFEPPVIQVIAVNVGDRSHFPCPKMTTPAFAGVVALKGLAN